MRDQTAQLARIWREHAALLRSYGAATQADILERCASEMEAEHAARLEARVGIAAAVEITGYSRAHLRRLVRTGKLRNVGTNDAPEFIAAELPRKVRDSNTGESIALGNGQPVYFSKQVARAIVRGEG